MAESRIKDENYYQVQGWMLNRLGLKGNALNVYAIIYAFSQDGESCFSGSLKYLMDFTNASRRTIINTLKDLTEKGYLVKWERLEDGVKFCTYRAVKNPSGSMQKLHQGCKNCTGGSAETAPGAVQNLHVGSAETAPNNKLDNKSNNKEYKKLCASVSKKDADAHFEIIWKLYLRKRGKDRVSDARKKLLYLVSVEEMTRAIDRYEKDLKKEPWRKRQDGSTFFNGGYVDYLDHNYTEGGDAYGGAEEHPAKHYGTVL